MQTRLEEAAKLEEEIKQVAKDAEAAGIKPTNSSDKSKNDKVASETVEDLKAENKKDSKENKGIGETLCDIGGDILEGVAEWFQSEEVQEVLKTIGIAAVAALMAVLIGPYIAAGLISIFGLTATTAVTAMTITSYVFTAGATYGTLDSASEGEPFLESLREGIETGATWTIIALVLYASYLLVLEQIALVGKITPESIADALDGVYQTIQEWFNGDDTSTKLNYITSNGLQLETTPGRTTTVLGSYNSDTAAIIEELGNVKSLDFGPKDGGFNLLNVPDELYVSPEQFWNEYNKPWLDNAVQRNDIIKIATEPVYDNLYRLNPVTGELELTGFGREFTYLTEKLGYVYDSVTKTMIPSK